jgi:hypothetical protein
VERQFLNTPRDIIFDDSCRVMSKPINDEIFNSVKDLTDYWGRFIDDMFDLFRGNYTQAKWYFDKLISVVSEVHMGLQQRGGNIFKCSVLYKQGNKDD